MNTAYDAPRTAKKLLMMALGLLDTLDPEQQRAVVHSFQDPRRLDWDFIPKPDRTGLALHHFSRSQRVILWDLLRAAMPLRTFTQVLSIPQLEHVLRDYEGPFLDRALSAWRSSDSYRLTIFGRPGFEDTWSIRFLGHHVCINVTVVGERWVTATPAALGQQPVNYDGVIKPLRDEEDAAFELLRTLSETQHDRAIIHDVAAADFVTRYVTKIGRVEYPDHYDLGMPQYQLSEKDRIALRFERAHPAGIGGGELTIEQQEMLLRIVDLFLGRLPEELVERHQQIVRDKGIDRVHFAWAGGEEPGTPHYFRIQTDDYLIEFVNAIGGGDHIHSVLRDLEEDHAGGILAEFAAHERERGHHLDTRVTSSDEVGPLWESPLLLDRSMENGA